MLLCALHLHGEAALGALSADHRSAMQVECHALDGSAMLKMLNEISMAAEAQAILASAQAQPTGFVFVTLMVFMPMLVF